MAKIHFLACDTSACGRYRCELPAAGLAALGHETTVAVSGPTSQLLNCDVLVGQRVMNPAASNLWRLIAGNSVRPRTMVYELDDDVWALRLERENPASRHWTFWELEAVVDNMRAADAVTVSTERLADAVRGYLLGDTPVHVVPNAVPDDLVQRPSLHAERSPVIGWGGSPTHEGDWRATDLGSHLGKWLRRWPEWTLHVLGSDAPVSLRGGLQAWGAMHHAKTVGWTSDWNEYYRRVSRFAVGLAPLAETPFNAGKSDLRLLEYAALGVPWVASNFGPYAHSSTGGAARGGLRVHGSTWTAALDHLAREPEVRAELRAEGRQWASTRTVSAVAPVWAAALGV